MPQFEAQPLTARPIVMDLRRHFRHRFGDDRALHIACAPGRVNLIGDHTDYNDGFVLPATIDRAVYVAARRRSDDRVLLHSVNFEQDFEATTDTAGDVSGSEWHVYVAGVINEYLKNGGVDSGIEAAVHGDVPLGAGLSSSAAIEVSTALALQSLFGFKQSAQEMALLCRHVEHTYAGVKCGIMDQFASRLGRSGHALFLDCRSLEYRHVPLDLAPSGVQLVIANSNVGRKLSSSKYNERRKECEEAAAYFRRFEPGVEALRDVSGGLLKKHGDGMPRKLLNRARHVVTENARVVSALKALESADWDAFGELMNASHESLRDDYEVSSPELDALAEGARSIDGTLGARMTGAGFGGCTVNLVRSHRVPDFVRELTSSYHGRTGIHLAPYVMEENFEAGVLYVS